MSLFDQFLVMAAIICSFSGCAAISMDRAVEAETVSAVAEPGYSDSDSPVGGTIYFDYDKYNLSTSAVSEIRNLAKSIKSNSSKVRIEGHCDERGTREYNLALGERRAQAVKNYLNGLGVGASSMSTISYGKERPAVVGSNDAAWSQNRRSVTTVN